MQRGQQRRSSTHRRGAPAVGRRATASARADGPGAGVDADLSAGRDAVLRRLQLATIGRTGAEMARSPGNPPLDRLAWWMVCWWNGLGVWRSSGWRR